MTHELTSSLLTQMRQADRITFHLAQHEDGSRESQIRLHPDEEVGHFTVPCDTAFVDYGEPFRVHYRLSGYHMVHHPHMAEHIRTLVWEILRADDWLTLKWVRSNNNENTRSVRWQTDQLYLTITRRKQRLSFLIATQTGPDNTARMIREHYVSFAERHPA